MKYLISASLLSACTPTIVFVDRPTLMEVESTGEWPEWNLPATKVEGSLLPRKEEDLVDQRVYRILDGEYP